MYLLTSHLSDNTAGVITLCLGRGLTMGKGVSSLIVNQLRGVSACCSAGGGGESLQVTEVTGDICIFQVKMSPARDTRLRASLSKDLVTMRKIELQQF